MKEAVVVLHKLKRRMNRERMRFNKIYAESTDPLSRERAFGESNVCGLAIKFMDEEIVELEKHEH